MALVENAAAALRFTPVARILATATPGVDRLGRIVDQVRPRVGRRKAQALRKAMLVPALQGMVDGVGIRRNHTDAGVLRIRTARLNRSGTRIRLVEILQTGIDVSALAAYPPYFHDIVRGEFAGDLQIPILHVSVMAQA